MRNILKFGAALIAAVLLGTSATAQVSPQFGPGQTPCAYTLCTVGNLTVKSTTIPSDGIYDSVGDGTVLAFAASGARSFFALSGSVRSDNANAWTLSNTTPTATVPDLITNNLGSSNTGVGGASGHIALIAGGVNEIDCVSTGCSATNLNLTSATIPTNGVYLSAANALSFSTNGTAALTITSAGVVRPLFSVNSNDNQGFQLTNTAATATVPSVVNNRVDTTTGLGGSGNHVALIATNVNQFDCISTGCSAPLLVSLSSGWQATGTQPTITGTCTTGSKVGGATAGSFTATCTAQTAILSLPTAAHGWVCIAQDQTTVANAMKQTANTTTSCTLTGTTVAADVIVWTAVGY